MTDQKTISAYDSQVDNYVEIIKQQPVDNTLLDFIARVEAQRVTPLRHEDWARRHTR